MDGMVFGALHGGSYFGRGICIMVLDIKIYGGFKGSDHPEYPTDNSDRCGRLDTLGANKPKFDLRGYNNNRRSIADRNKIGMLIVAII